MSGPILSKINSDVQKTLMDRQKMLLRDKDFNIGETVSNEDANTMFTRAVWLKMSSLTKKGPILMGGELGTDGALKFGGDAIGDPLSSVYGKAVISFKGNGEVDEKTKNLHLRPMPGIKNANVEYKGVYKALRQASIDWVCWTVEDLERLEDSFLKHGRAILLEWGWSSRSIADISEVDLARNDLTDLSRIVRNKVIDGKGNYDAMLGVISNWEWNQRGDGGFDCRTKMVSLGANIFKEVIPSRNLSVQFRQTGEVNKFIAKNFKLVMSHIKTILINVAETEGGFSNGVYYERSLKKYYDMDRFIVRSNLLESEIGPYCSWGWFEDNVLSRFFGRVNDKDEILWSFRSIEPILETGKQKMDDGVPQFESVKIGNHSALETVDPDRFILPGKYNAGFNKTEEIHYFGAPVPTIQELTRVGLDITKVASPIYLAMREWRHGKTQDEIKELWDLQKEGTGKVSWDATDNGGDPKNYLVTFHAMTEWMGLSRPQRNSILQKRSLAERNWTGHKPKPFSADPENRSGYLRNILIHHQVLRDCFERVNTVEAGLDNLIRELNKDYKNIWNLKITTNETEDGLKVIDNFYSVKSVAETLENTSDKPAGGGGDPIYNKEGVFVFPVWESDSIVKSQNLTAKLPNEMQIAAVYGTNPEMLKEILSETANEEAAQAYGEMILGETETRDKLIGKVEIPYMDSEGKLRGFGNIKGDDPSGTLGVAEQISDDVAPGFDELLDNIIDQYKSKTGGGGSKGSELTSRFAAMLEATIEDFNKEGSTISQDFLELNTIFYQKTGATSDEWERMQKLNTQKYLGKWINGKMSPRRVNMLFQTIKGDGTFTSLIVPVELSLELDGIGGIIPGNSFHSSYLQQRYKDKCVFQVIAADHKIDSSGWMTTIKGQMRLKPKERL